MLPASSLRQLQGDVEIRVSEMLQRAGLESAPEAFWDAAQQREEAAWLKGRDDTLALIHEEVDGYIAKAFEEFTSTQPVPSRPLELLLDDDGPVLLELREVIGEELEAGGFRDEEGEGLYADHASAVWLGDQVSNRVKTVLAAALSVLSAASLVCAEVPDA